MKFENLHLIRSNISKNLKNPPSTIVKQYSNMNPYKFNCYMAAVGCTMPTEIYVGEVKGIPVTMSLIGEMDKTYFGTIGAFSGKTTYRTKEELVESMIGDMKVLGRKCVPCDENYKVPKNGYKIALFCDLNSLKEGRIVQFHFMIQLGQDWYYKLNWTEKFQRIPRKNSINDVVIEGMDLVGFFVHTPI